MKLSLDYRIKVDEDVLDSKTIEADAEKYRQSLADLSSIEGAIVLTLDGAESCADCFDPILRLGDQFISKLRWILSGDTETVAYRNSEHCFAFVPTGDSVEISFFVGDETEIEDYLVDPTNVRLDSFAPECIKLMDRVLSLMARLAPDACASNADFKDLQISLNEAKGAWKEYQLHNRR